MLRALQQSLRGAIRQQAQVVSAANLWEARDLAQRA